MKKIKRILSSLVIAFVCLFGLNSCGVDVNTAYEYSKQVNLEEYKTLSAITFTKTVSSRSLKNPLEEGIKSRTYKVCIGQTMADDNGDGVKEAKKDCAMKVEESYVTTSSSKSVLRSSTIYTKKLTPAEKDAEVSEQVYDYTKFIYDTENLYEEILTEEDFYATYDNLKQEIYSYIVLPESPDVISASGSESNLSTVTMSFVSSAQSLVTYNLTINKWNKSTVLEGKYKVGKLTVDDGNAGTKTVYTWEYPEYLASLTAYTLTNAAADLEDYQKYLDKKNDGNSSEPSEDSSVPTEDPSNSVESTEPESTPEITEDPSSDNSTEPSETPSEDPSVPSEEITESTEPSEEPSVEPSETPSEPTEIPSEETSSEPTTSEPTTEPGSDVSSEEPIVFEDPVYVYEDETFERLVFNWYSEDVDHSIILQCFNPYECYIMYSHRVETGNMITETYNYNYVQNSREMITLYDKETNEGRIRFIVHKITGEILEIILAD